MDVESSVTGWVHGWAVSRGAPVPERRAHGWFIATGTAKEAARYVLTAAGDVSAVLADTGTPDVWVKVCAPAEAVRPLLTDGWTFVGVEHLMHVDIGSPSPGRSPAGYRLTVEAGGGVVRVVVQDGGGAVAATGRSGIAGGVGVIDQVVTEPDHRRRGLASVVMGALMRELAGGGVSRAVLVATDEGRELYARLGWEYVSPVSVAVSGPGARG